MLKWILVSLGVLATLVAVPFVVGLFLPKEHIAASSITLSHPPDSVWKIVRDLGGYPNWWTDVKSSKRETDVGEREVWVQTDATDQALPLEPLTDRPCEAHASSEHSPAGTSSARTGASDPREVPDG